MAPLPDKLELRDGERIVAELSVSKKVTIGLIGAGALCLLVAFLSPFLAPLLIPGTTQADSVGAWLLVFVFAVAGCVIMSIGFQQEVAHRYYLTNERLIIREGILISQTMSIEYEEMGTVTYTRDPLSRALGVGTIIISAGEPVFVRLVDDPRVWVGRITKFQEEFSKAVRDDDGKREEVEASTRQVIAEAEADPATKDTTVTSAVIQSVKRVLRKSSTESTVSIDDQLLPTEARTPEEIRQSRSDASSEVRAAQKKLEGGA